MRKSITSAVFAALICAGWMMSIPVGPIPIVLQNALAVLAGLLLGPLFGGLSVLLFLVAGAVVCLFFRVVREVLPSLRDRRAAF